jgi:flavodoxin I
MGYPEKDRLTSGIIGESEIYSILVGREAMKTLVVYDSLYGNTKAIAQAIGDALPGEVEVLPVGEANASGLKSYDLLVVGAPTHAARPSPNMQQFLDEIQSPALEGISVAGFDTRMTNRLITLFGTAAPKIAKVLEEKGGTLAGKPEGFYVTGGEGPLKDGEVERAAAWAHGLIGN